MWEYHIQPFTHSRRALPQKVVLSDPNNEFAPIRVVNLDY